MAGICSAHQGYEATCGLCNGCLPLFYERQSDPLDPRKWESLSPAEQEQWRQRYAESETLQR